MSTTDPTATDVGHTVAQYEAAITAALQAHDIEAIPSLLTLMSREHPREAADLLGAMRLVADEARRAEP